MPKRKLKIGLLIDSYNVPLWAYKMIEYMVLSDFSEVSLIVRKQKNKQKQQSFFKKIWTNKHKLLFRIYSKLEDSLYILNPNAFETKDLRELINCTEIIVQPKETKFSDRIVEEDIEKIKQHEIDVFVRLGFRILRGAILKSSRYGVWSYHHGDNKVNRGGPAGVWELLRSWKQTRVVLQILTEELDNGLLLYESALNTHKLSIKKNKNNLYWKTKSFIPRKLEELYKEGEEHFFRKIEKTNSQPFFYSNKIYVTPKNSEMIKGLVSNSWALIKMSADRLFYKRQWILLFNLEKEEKISQSFFKFKRIVPPNDRYWANPFAIQKNEKHYIFFEEFLYSQNKGHISVVEINQNGDCQKPEKILDKEYHLSYPFLIEDSGQLYMIPETQEANRIDLYRCKEFPLIWEFEKTLINNIEAVSPTLFKHNQKYWLYVNVKENKDASVLDELALYYTDNLLESEWNLHPLSPIISDVRCARSAGNLFVFKDRIFRPAQNTSKSYGTGIEIKEIIKLNEEEYEERQIQSISPNWHKDLISTKTLNSSGRLTVIDALVKKLKFL
jgi:hypothetical protein